VTELSSFVLPTAESELWRYSRIGELDLASMSVGRVSTSVVGDAEVGGTSAIPLSDVSGEEPDVFESLHEQHASVVRIAAARGRTVIDPVLVTHEVRDPGTVGFPSLEIDAAENSEVVVVERFVSGDGCRALLVPMVKIRAAQSARVTYVAINELARDTWMIGYQRASGGRDSTISTSTVALGGDYSRVRAAVRLVGQGASAKQVALYFADGNQMHDFRTLQDHAAPRTRSDLLFKGAVRDTAKSVYTGLIKIHKDAKGSSAFQTNRNLTLSKGAWAETVPNLDIETNDVKCSHASTVGPIDEDQLFYLESRGIRPDVAERLVVLGFFDEVLDQLPVGDLAAGLRKKVADKLSIGAES